MRRFRFAGLATAAAFLAGAFLLASCGRKKAARAEPLLCYVGGTMRPVMEELAALYRRRTGEEVVMDAAGSGELLVRMRATRKGDLYVSHDPFLGALRRTGLCGEAWAVASLTPVIVVAEGNPKGVRGLKDLARPDLRVGLTDEEYSTAGHIVALMLRRAGLEDAVERNVKTRTRQGSELANAVALGTLDAGIVWNAVAHLRREKLDAVPVEAEWLPRRGVDAVTSATIGSMEMDDVRVTIATLTCSPRPARARRFAAFVASPEAQRVFARHGFTPVDVARREADVHLPALEGSILIHCGAGMRRPIAELARDFTERTGVQVKANYAGSNVLLGQVELSGMGDVYIPGDADYVEMARRKGLVTFRRPICYFVPVIMVAKGNPLGVRSLADLAKPGVRVGLGDERAAAIGRLTERILRRSGIPREALAANVVLRTPTVNELGLKISLGTVDAVIVWSSTAAQYPESSETVAIPPEVNIVPTVAAATLTTARNPAAARAFAEHLRSARGRAVLARHHYVVERGR